jgi:hypothetical protein
MPPPRVRAPQLPGPPSPDYRLPPVQYDAYGRAIVGRGSTPPSGMSREADPYEEDEEAGGSLTQNVFGSADWARRLAQMRRAMALHESAGANLTQEEVDAMQGQLPQITPEQQEQMRQNWEAIRNRLLQPRR